MQILLQDFQKLKSGLKLDILDDKRRVVVPDSRANLYLLAGPILNNIWAPEFYLSDFPRKEITVP
jgi:hypothetical protein